MPKLFGPESSYLRGAPGRRLDTVPHPGQFRPESPRVHVSVYRDASAAGGEERGFGSRRSTPSSRHRIVEVGASPYTYSSSGSAQDAHLSGRRADVYPSPRQGAEEKTPSYWDEILRDDASHERGHFEEDESPVFASLSEDLRRHSGRLSDGKYHDARDDVGGTYGDVEEHASRMNLGPHEADLQAERDLQAVRRRRSDPFLSYPENATYSRRVSNERRKRELELCELEAALHRLQEQYTRRAQDHSDWMIDASQRYVGHRPESHHTKPARARGDGRSIRGADWE